jgi:hypothetical protein
VVFSFANSRCVITAMISTACAPLLHVCSLLREYLYYRFVVTLLTLLLHQHSGL